MEKVTTNHLMTVFNEIWVTVWNEKGYDLEFSEKADRFLIKNRHDVFAGTIEIKQLMNSETKDLRICKENDLIQANIKDILEIDKVAIVNGSRKVDRLLEQMLSLMIDYAVEKESKGIFALLEPKFYLSLRMLYKVPIVKLGKKFDYKGDDVVPVYFDMEAIKQALPTFSWYQSTQTKEMV